MSTSMMNYHNGRSANAKRVKIPFTITGSATVGSIRATIDDEFADSNEIFVAVVTGTGVDGSNGGVVATPGSVIDTSANDANGKAFPLLCSSDTTAMLFGFIVLDGSGKTLATIPQPGNGNNPSYSSTQQTFGSAQKILGAEVVFTDGAATTCPSGTRGWSTRANTLTAGVTPNGNLKVLIQLPVAVPLVAATPTEVSPTFTAAGTLKGVLDVTYIG